MQEKIRSWLKGRILRYHAVPACSRVLIDILFASLCYHLEYLNDNLHTECRFRASALYHDIPQDILDCAVVVYP